MSSMTGEVVALDHVKCSVGSIPDRGGAGAPAGGDWTGAAR